MERFFIVGFLIACITLTACAPFSTRDQRAGVCNELNSQLIFGGNTSNVRQSAIEDASLPMVQKSYDTNNCNQ